MPASDTMMFAMSLLRQRRGLTGVGLPQPMSGEKPPAPTTMMKLTMGMSRVPTGSVCATGFSVTRPSMYAVSSPNLYDIQACPASWTEIASRSTTM